MRSKQQNIQDLSNALQSPNWQALKQALVGRELIAFGAELMYQTESIVESLQKPLYINTASFNEIIAAAFHNDITLDLVASSTVKVRLSTHGTVYYKPYDIRLESGNIIYTNIDFIDSDQVITLYQGIPTSVSNFDTSIRRLNSIIIPCKREVGFVYRVHQFTYIL